MDPVAGASFIPKKPLVGDAPRGSAGTSIFTLVALFVFTLSLVAAGGALGWGTYLKSSIAGKDASLKLAEGAFDTGAIEDLVRLDSRIGNAQALLGKHVAPSGIFALLANLTLERVQLTSFDYDLGANGSAKITLGGTADSFSTLALQSDQFSASKVLKDVIFSGIATQVGGRVTFNVAAGVDASVLSFSKNLQGVASVEPLATSSVPQ